MNHRIRLALPTEAEALSRLAYDAKSSWGYPPDWIASWRDELTITPEYVERHQVFVAVSDSGLAGMGALELSAQRADLEHLWVASDHQGRGVGKALVRHALATALSAGHAVVHVASDPNATRFYRSFGGTACGSVPAPMPGAPERALPLFQLPTGPTD